MQLLITFTLWAVLAVGKVASHVAHSLQRGDLEIASLHERDLLGNGLDHTESFTWSKNNESVVDLSLGDHVLDVNCTRCHLSGNVRATFDERLDFWESDLNISFTGTSFYIDVDLLVETGHTQAIGIWGGIKATLGLGFYFELVVSADGALDASGGFNFTIPEGSWISVGLDGDILETNFNGIEGDSLPWDVRSGDTTVKISLRLRTEFGVSVSVLGIPQLSVEPALGLYLNLLEFVSTFEHDDKNKTCAQEITSHVNINAGAYGKFDDHVSSSMPPTQSTTFFSGPTLTQCQASTVSTVSSTITQEALLPSTTS